MIFITAITGGVGVSAPDGGAPLQGTGAVAAQFRLTEWTSRASGGDCVCVSCSGSVVAGGWSQGCLTRAGLHGCCRCWGR